MENKNYALAFGILAASIIIATLIGGMFFLKIKRGGDVISVTGSAKVSITSDSAKYTADLSRVVTEGSVKDGYAQIAKDVSVVQKTLIDAGLQLSEFTFTTASLNENYNYDSNGHPILPKTYTIRQMLTVSSTNLDAMKKFADNTSVIANEGVLLQNASLQYFYSKLPDLRIELLGKAVADAKNRAAVIAKESGSHLGTLQSASSGVVQLLAPNSVDVEDYGAYDTSTKDKDVMMTVRTTFRLR